MDLTFVLYALLLSGIASLFDRELRKGGTFAGFGFLAALAPVLAKGVSSIIGHQKQKGEAKKQAAYEQQQAAAQEAADRAKFEAAQDTPAAAMQRLKFNTGLAKILGQFGGRDKTPAFLLNAFDTARKRQEYVPGAAAVPKPQQGGGFWNFASGLTDALSYLDTSKITKKPGAPMVGGGLAGAKIDAPVKYGSAATGSNSVVQPLVTQTKRLPFL